MSASPLFPFAGDRSKLVVEQAIAELRGGNPAEARRLLLGQLAADPRDLRALASIASLEHEEGRLESVTLYLRRMVDVAPTADNWLILLRHLAITVGPHAALAEIELVPAAVREIPGFRAFEAAMAGEIGDEDRQIALYRSILDQNPADAGVWKSLADSLKTVGETAQGVDALRRAIALRPEYGEAYWTLANFKSFTFSEREIGAMRRALRKKLSPVDALHFHFALGKAFEQAGKFSPSFKHYEAGNRLRAGLEPYVSEKPFIDYSIGALNQGYFDEASGRGCEDPDPIFVLGVQRSGSTLVEQILASHSQVEGTTEIKNLAYIWSRVSREAGARGMEAYEYLRTLPPEQIRSLGEEYLHRSKPYRRTDRPFFVDKLPANWMFVGFIRLILPNARIIDARRHPMACGFSNYAMNYARGMTFSYSLERIGAFYRDYWRLMRHFDALQPGRVHRVINERLIDDPPREIRAMLEYLGLPFEESCLNSHQNKRAIRTPSAEQVRQQINRAGVDQWRNYEQWLGPLKVALGPALTDWDR